MFFIIFFAFVQLGYLIFGSQVGNRSVSDGPISSTKTFFDLALQHWLDIILIDLAEFRWYIV